MPWRKTDSKAAQFERFESALDPAETQRFFDCLDNRQGLPAGGFLVKNQPYFDFRPMIILQPLAKILGGVKRKRFADIHIGLSRSGRNPDRLSVFQLYPEEIKPE